MSSTVCPLLSDIKPGQWGTGSLIKFEQRFTESKTVAQCSKQATMQTPELRSTNLKYLGPDKETWRSCLSLNVGVIKIWRDNGCAETTGTLGWDCCPLEEDDKPWRAESPLNLPGLAAICDTGNAHLWHAHWPNVAKLMRPAQSWLCHWALAALQVNASLWYTGWGKNHCKQMLVQNCYAQSLLNMRLRKKKKQRPAIPQINNNIIPGSDLKKNSALVVIGTQAHIPHLPTHWNSMAPFKGLPGADDWMNATTIWVKLRLSRLVCHLNEALHSGCPVSRMPCTLGHAFPDVIV